MSKEKASGFITLSPSFHIQQTVNIQEEQRQPNRQGLE
jgi:hypothetical protein